MTSFRRLTVATTTRSDIRAAGSTLEHGHSPNVAGALVRGASGRRLVRELTVPRIQPCRTDPLQRCRAKMLDTGMEQK